MFNQRRDGVAMTATIVRKAAALRTGFFFLGVLVGGWSTRIPEIKTALKMSDAVLGRTLMGAALGSLLSSRLVGWLVRELGPKKVFYIGTAIFPLGYLTIALAPNPFFIFLGIFFFTQGYMYIDNPMTVMTQELEKVSDRKYLSGFHAFWSIGTLSAAFFGSFLIGHVKYSTHLIGIATLAFVSMIIASRTFDSQVAGAEKPKKVHMPWFKGRFSVVIWAVGIGMLCSNSAEFGATDWSALFLRDILGITGQLYVGAYIAFEAGMISSRLSGDKLIHRYGPEKVIRAAGFLAAGSWFISMMLGINLNDSHHVIAYLVTLEGYFLAGAGVGPLFPAFITVLGSVKGIEMAEAFARALVIAILGFAVAPALIGAISDATSLTTAMLFPMALLVLAGLMGRSARLAEEVK
jgi:fucose permease